MKVTLSANSTVTVNGVEIVLGKGTEVELPCQTKEHALEICAVTRLKVDFNYTQKGVKYIVGAGGKFIPVPTVEPKAVKPDAPTAKVTASLPKTKAKK